MLESTQSRFLSQGRIVNLQNVILEFMRASGKLMLSLITPEDSGENADGRQHQSIQDNGNTVCGAVKVVFWMAAAIILSILVGQLS